MKKILSAFLAGIMIFALSACGNSSTENTENGTSQPQNSVSDTTSNTTEPSSDASEATEPEAEASKSLVVYFSWSGNTKAIAEEIAKQTGSDIFEIVPVNAYSNDYNTVIDDAQAEQRNNARPEIKGTVDNFADYDTVYFGFPNWWGDMPMIMYTFLDTYDFSGKTIAEFVSSSSSGLSDTINSLKKSEPNATVTEGLSITGSTSNDAESKVRDWLSEIGLK